MSIKTQKLKMCFSVCEVKAHVPHVFQPIHRQEIGRHGKVQLVDEGRDLRRGVQQVDDGAPELTQLSLEGRKHSEAREGALPEGSPMVSRDWKDLL